MMDRSVFELETRETLVQPAVSDDDASGRPGPLSETTQDQRNQLRVIVLRDQLTAGLFTRYRTMVARSMPSDSWSGNTCRKRHNNEKHTARCAFFIYQGGHFRIFGLLKTVRLRHFRY